MCYPSLTEENGRPCGGNDNRFAYNVIEHVGYECTDTGAFCARIHRPPSLLPCAAFESACRSWQTPMDRGPKPGSTVGM